MPSWWRKSSCKDLKQATGKRSLIESIQKMKLQCSYKERTLSTSSIPSLQAPRSYSFGEEPAALPQPLPCPPNPPLHADFNCCSSESFVSSSSNNSFVSSPLVKKGWAGEKVVEPVWKDLITVTDTNDPFFDNQILSPQGSDINSTCTSSRSKVHSTIGSGRILNEQLSPYSAPCGKHILLPSTDIRRPEGAPLTKLQVAPRPLLFSASDSSTSSPSVKAWTGEKEIKLDSPSYMNLVGSAHFSCDQFSVPKPVSEHSSISSPRTSSSSGQGYDIQRGGVTPVHQKPESHKLPLPPGGNHAQFRMSLSTSWKKGRLLGNGTCGQVYRGLNSETGEMCTMKEVTLFSDDPKSKQGAHQLNQEIALLSRLRHPNIVHYFGSEMVDNKPCIYMECVSGRSIKRILRDYGQLRESVIRTYTKQILSGLVYLHSNNTAHRNLKGANVLVDPTGRVKLQDFGMAKHITGQSHPLKGRVHWMAPEVIENSSECGLAVDIWSLGCTVIEMATTQPPWSQCAGVALLFEIWNSKQCPPTLDHLSAEGKDFLRQCLQRNPRDRPTAMQLLRHPFVSDAASPQPHRTADTSQRYKGLYAKTMSTLDLEEVAIQCSMGLSRNPNVSKHLSCPVTPISKPLLHPKTQSMFSSRSPVSISQTASDSSILCTNGNVALNVNHMDDSSSYLPLHDVMGTQRPQKSLHVGNNQFYCKRKLETLVGDPEASQVNGSIASCQSDLAGIKHAQSFHKRPEGHLNRHSVIASRFSQQHLMELNQCSV